MPGPSKTRTFKVGKIPPAALLRSVFPYLGNTGTDIVVKPGIGRDAAVIRRGSNVLVFSTDPITGTATHIGAHSVFVNANDIATTGAQPTWYLCTILLPPGTSERALRRIMVEIDQASKKLGVTVVGGHTEITEGLPRPIIAGFMVGEVGSGRVLSPGGARAGDRVLFTKTAGLEGTAILASDYSNRLRQVPRSTISRARTLYRQIGVVKQALEAAEIQGVHALHDPTEGGVLNGLWELAEASSLGINVWADKIAVSPDTQKICEALGLDPLRLMCSGSLLVAVQPSAVAVVDRRLGKMGVKVSEVGSLTPRAMGRYLFRIGKRKRLEAVPMDELYRLD